MAFGERMLTMCWINRLGITWKFQQNFNYTSRQAQWSKGPICNEAPVVAMMWETGLIIDNGIEKYILSRPVLDRATSPIGEISDSYKNLNNVDANPLNL